MNEPLTEAELSALHRRRDLVANPAVPRAVENAVQQSELTGPSREALMKRVVLQLLRLTPIIELDALGPDDLDRLVTRITAAAGSDLGPIPSPDGRPPT